MIKLIDAESMFGNLTLIHDKSSKSLKGISLVEKAHL